MIIAILPNNITQRVYLYNIKIKVKEYLNKYDYQLRTFKLRFTDNDIERALESITCINGTVSIPTNGRNGEILRTLEYGASYLKQLKILSRATREVTKEVSTHEYVI